MSYETKVVNIVTPKWQIIVSNDSNLVVSYQ